MLTWIRNLDIRKVAVVLTALGAVAHAIVSGEISLDHLFPASWDDTIKAWCGVYLWALPLLVGAHAFTALDWSKPARTGGPSSMSAGIGRGAALIAFLLLPTAIAVWLVSGGAARAADLAPQVKAPPLLTTSLCTPEHCTGFYLGFNMLGTATNANVLANGINGSVAGGGQSIGVQAGYQYWNGTWFFGPEVSADYTYGGGQIIGGGQSKFLAMEIVKFGTPFSTFFGSGITPASTSGLPSLLTANTISPYLFMGAAQRNWGTGIASGGGVTFAVDQQHWFVDARYTNVQYTGGNQVNPNVSVPQENIISVGLNYKF